MKIVGYVLIGIGLALAFFLAHSWFVEQNKLRSPMVEESGVKVIYITPIE